MKSEVDEFERKLGFNPLNQVYVFNPCPHICKLEKQIKVLIP